MVFSTAAVLETEFRFAGSAKAKQGDVILQLGDYGVSVQYRIFDFIHSYLLVIPSKSFLFPNCTD